MYVHPAGDGTPRDEEKAGAKGKAPEEKTPVGEEKDENNESDDSDDEYDDVFERAKSGTTGMFSL